jgi:hypothetical protein
MRRIRFRIRTLAIVVALLALLMGLLTLWLRWIARTDASLVGLIVMAVTVVLVIPLLALVCVLSFYFRRSVARGEFIDWIHPSAHRRDSERSGDAE